MLDVALRIMRLEILIDRALKPQSVASYLPFIYLSTLHALHQRDSEPCVAFFEFILKK